MPQRHVAVTRLAGLALGLAVLGLAAAPAAAQGTGGAAAKPAKPAKPACGLTGIPFVVGNEWVYELAVSPIVSNDAQLARMPKQPDKVTIKVTAVDAAAGMTTIKLNETIETKLTDRVDGKDVTRTESKSIDTELRCDAKHLDVAPESFFFAGEPGGSIGITLGEVTRTGVSYALKGGFLAGPSWTETLAATFSAAAAAGTSAPPATGTVDFERTFLVGPPESVTTPLGIFTASRVVVELIGQVKLSDQADKPYDLPANMNSHLWFAKGIGLVQVLNSYTHYYQLTATNVM